jgi:MoaA/NifB/PqqE/SkfB family radical SAM enzyme
MIFKQSPRLVIWETTQACDLACPHCRPSARSARDSRELTLQEGKELLDEIQGFGDPLMVFTGGDPLRRTDLFDLLRHSVSIGLRTTVAPAMTPLLTPHAIDAFHDSGVSRMTISLNGPDGAARESAPGMFDIAVRALRHARSIGFETQLQTIVTRRNIRHLAELGRIAADVHTRMWNLVFLVVTGRAVEEDQLTVEEYEKAFAFLCDLSQAAPLDIRSTATMDYGDGTANRPEGGNHERGFVMISSTGEIYPSVSDRSRRAMSGPTG